MGEIKLLAGLLMASLFAICIVSYAIGWANNNNAVVDLGDDPTITKFSTETKGNMTRFSSQVNTSKEDFKGATTEAGDEQMKEGKVFKLGGIWKAVTGVKNILGLVNSKIFKGSVTFALLTSTLIFFICYMTVRYIYKSWFGKNPD